MWAWVVAELVSLGLWDTPPPPDEGQGQVSIAGAGLCASPPRALESWGQLSHADVFGASSGGGSSPAEAGKGKPVSFQTKTTAKPKYTLILLLFYSKPLIDLH